MLFTYQVSQCIYKSYKEIIKLNEEKQIQHIHAIVAIYKQLITGWLTDWQQRSHWNVTPAWDMEDHPL